MYEYTITDNASKGVSLSFYRFLIIIEFPNYVLSIDMIAMFIWNFIILVRYTSFICHQVCFASDVRSCF